MIFGIRGIGSNPIFLPNKFIVNKNMDDVKVNLTLLVPSATIMSEQECSKRLKKPVINKRGRYAGKQARDKQGNPLWHYVEVPDLEQYDKNVMMLEKEGVKNAKEPLVYYTRKQRMVRQTLNMTSAAYNYFISKEMPQGYHAPKNFKPYMPIRSHLDRKTKKWVEGISIDAQAWKAASTQQRLEWHLNSICASLGGIMGSYTVFND